MADIEIQCPAPQDYEQIVMAHGGGGRLMQQLLDNLIRPVFDNPILDRKDDSAVFDIEGVKLAFTTDSYVVKPVFFPGGDIGKLAVCGTLNDLAMSGAKPLYLSCSLIIEEGFPLEDLKRIVRSMQNAAQLAGVQIVTGDTKVVDRGSGDGLYINTAGIGMVRDGLNISASHIADGDCIIVSSDIARHGIAVLLTREGMTFDHTIASDCADLSGLVGALLEAGIGIHCLRDLTRGGLASGLIELASGSNRYFRIHESAVPLQQDVASACDILGFDPFYIANEGCCALFVPHDQCDAALTVLRQHPLGRKAALIGRVMSHYQGGQVGLMTPFGIERVIDLLSGEQWPRIC